MNNPVLEAMTLTTESHGRTVECTAELEREAREDKGREEDREKTLPGASEGDGLIFGRFEGLGAAGLSTAANLQSVPARSDWNLKCVVHCEGTGTLTVNDDVVRSSSDFDSDCFMCHFESCGHSSFPPIVGKRCSYVIGLSHQTK
jgi:hypothetical protein